MKIYEIFKEHLEEYDDISRRFGGLMLIWEKYIKEFEKDETYNMLKESFLNGDTDNIEKYSHKLKGTAYNLGFVILGTYARTLNNEAKKTDNVESLKKYFVPVIKEYFEIMELYKKNK